MLLVGARNAIDGLAFIWARSARILSSRQHWLHSGLVSNHANQEEPGVGQDGVLWKGFRDVGPRALLRWDWCFHATCFVELGWSTCSMVFESFSSGQISSSHEVTHGKRYTGKTACFAEPVYAYCKSRGKTDATWRVGLMLGKTGAQDAWIIGDGVDVILSRSIRRVDQPCFLAYYSGLQTHSFVYQTNFGGRIVPTKRKITPQRQDGLLLPKLTEVERRFADEEA